MSNLRNDKEAEWPNNITEEFLKLVYDSVKQYLPGQFTFNGSHWNDINTELRVKIGAVYSSHQLQGKYERWKTLYKLFSDVLNHTGVTFDAVTNRALADEWIWEKFMKTNKRLYTTLKNLGCEHFDLYCLIFPDNIATGGLVHPSSQPPVDSNEEKEIEDDYMTTVNMPKRSGNTSKGKRSADEMINNARKSVNKGWKDNFTSAFVSYSDMMSEDFTERMEERKAKQMCRMQRQECGSGMSTGGSIDRLTRSVQILNETTTLSHALYNRAYKKFLECVDSRIGFIAMSPERRLDWLNSDY